MASQVDERRLRDVAAALALPEPATAQERQAQLWTIGAAIAASQSLDDLGEEANRKAYDDQLELWRRYDRLKALR